MPNTGRTKQPGGHAAGTNYAMNEVKDVAAAWRYGQRLRTPVRLEGEGLEGTVVTIGDRAMTFRGWSLNFYLRPGTYEAILDDEGLEVTEVNGEAGTEFTPGAPVVLTVAESEE